MLSQGLLVAYGHHYLHTEVSCVLDHESNANTLMKRSREQRKVGWMISDYQPMTTCDGPDSRESDLFDALSDLEPIHQLLVVRVVQLRRSVLKPLDTSPCLPLTSV